MQILAGVGAAGFDISGGQETVIVGGYKYVVFTSSGTLTVSGGTGTVALCTVGGGGGSGFDIPGGGGGGELDLFANFTVSADLTMTIGSGGARSTTSATKGTNGGTSTVVEGATTHQSALGGGGSGSGNGAQAAGLAGGSGGGGSYGAGAGGGASGSNTFAGGLGFSTVESAGGGGGGATAVGLGTPLPSGGQGFALSSIDANLTAANFPTTLTGKTYVSSGGGAAYYHPSDLNGPQAGGTNAGTGEYDSPVRQIAATAATSYGCGGGGGGGFGGGLTGTVGFAGLIIAKIAQ